MDKSMNHLNHNLTVMQLTKKKVETQINVLNLKTLNEIKKDYTNIKISKISSFDSNFNSLQSLNGDFSQPIGLTLNNNKNSNKLNNNIQKSKSSVSTLSAILRAYRTIRLNRGEWKLIRLLILGNNYAANFYCNKKNNHSNKNLIPNFLTFALGLLSKAKLNNKNISGCLHKGVRITNSLSSTRVGVVNLIANFFINKNKVHYSKIIGYKFNSLNSFVQKKKIAAGLGAKKKINSLNKELYKTSLALAFYSYFNNKNTQNPVAGASPLTLSKFSLNRGSHPHSTNNLYIKDTYKLLFYFFKSMYCLISKPVLKYSNDKLTIQLFYYLNIPKKKIFRLFSIFYLNSNLRLRQKKKKGVIYNSNKASPFSGLAQQVSFYGKNNKASAPNHLFLRNKIHNRWKIRKAISIFKNKNSNSIRKQTNLLFKLRKFNLTTVFQNKFNLICAILSKKFNKAVELQLIRLHHPYYDSNILLNLLSLNILNKRKKTRVAIKKIFNNKPVKDIKNRKNNFCLQSNSSPSYLNSNSFSNRGQSNNLNFMKLGYITPAFLSGLNIKIAGRLLGEPIIPRITTKVYGTGATAPGKVNYLDVARITKKNKKGAYSIKITSGQNLF